jgi:hypothetical protein
LVHFMGFWNIVRYTLWAFDIYFHIFVCCTKKNLATPFPTSKVPPVSTSLHDFCKCQTVLEADEFH